MKSIPLTSIIQPTPMPPPVITFPNPLSYEFQVVEYTKDSKVVKVELQSKVNSHDQYGNIVVEGYWTAVPRVIMPMPDL